MIYTQRHRRRLRTPTAQTEPITVERAVVEPAVEPSVEPSVEPIAVVETDATSHENLESNLSSRYMYVPPRGH